MSSVARKHLLSLADWNRGELEALFELAEQYEAGGGPRFDGAAAMFFPPTSLRTRLSFERGATAMGLQPITFPSDSLDKDEDLVDVVGYLSQWADVVVVRHPQLTALQRLASADAAPVINAMTSENHPCEVLSDLYALSRHHDISALRYLFVGGDGNIARAWWEAAQAFGLEMRQSCPEELRVVGMPWEENLPHAIASADVVLTDGPGRHAELLEPYRVTAALLDRAPRGVRLAPCPPFIRGREVSADAIEHPAFVGYSFKRHLMPVQQAILARSINA
ncbi:putative ornithine carbamoyltransferase [Corynebacterium glutamicum MB001]|uniref:ornithine carbamoyltransferase n=1 Tax=Corynebacterium glutamicum TaxID=1718 RepID=UPI00001AE05B|nr:ornithine carbamoyltransferase [Corynebacterium glutamicum]AGT05028.1 putative ornithine carbamoyltransferase [Corynebacterium glutamicum MB001]NII97266.1 ornithine carbamoyltransferase [Corynebacterium glutamicum]QYO73263.1 putative ornithine carbamoyltransferase [Corynebacterium glutamicum]WBG75601.1 ornithine carbamoyltransferase [Corynebacterium glutamicum]CAF19737.1 PROBABLE ORNITHINE CARBAMOYLTRANSFERASE PROTEIN [Corynebacterium glutamicum ATCC 13032]